MTSVRALWRRPDVRFLVLFLGILLVVALRQAQQREARPATVTRTTAVR